ncbi:MAG: type VII secretion integral membrane protein EccD [Mycobacterium sp.]
MSVHTGTAAVDLTLPSRVPIAVLIPSIVDVLDGKGGEGGIDSGEAWRYELSLPGVAPLSGSKTLADSDIRDGTVLVLARDSAPLEAPRYDDAAHAVSATLAAVARPWGRRRTRLTGALAASSLTGTGGLALLRNSLTHNQPGAAVMAACAGLAAWLFAVSAHRAWGDPIAALALSLISTSFAGVAGFLAVPGRPGIPHALLAAAGASATAVLAMKAANCGAVTLTAIACTGAVIGAAALAGVVTSAALQTLGSVSTVVSLGLLGAAARVSIILAGLSPAPDPDETGAAEVPAKAIRADQLLTSLLWAFASTAAVGAAVTVFAGAPRLCCIGFGALTGALLLLRSRGNDAKQTLVFVITGITVTATTFGVAAMRAPGDGQWVAAGSAVLAGAALCLGFIVPARSPSPIVRRGVALLEASALIAMVPLTCWICDLYGTVRGLVPG